MSVSVTLKSYFYEVLIPSSQKNTSSPIEDILHHVSISFMKKLALYKCFNPRTHTGCDIGNSTTLMRGTQLPDNTIVASRSFVNKSFLGYHDDGILIAGSPGKVVRLGDQRVFSAQKEMEIRAFFKKSKMTEMWLAESDFFFYE